MFTKQYKQNNTEVKMGYRMEGSSRSGPFKIVGLVATGIIGVIVLTIGLSSFDKVDATEHCVKTRWGRVITQKVENGLTSTIAADLTCFPLTQQQFPGGAVRGEEAASETVEFLTRDSIMMSAEIALNWKYVNVDSAFTTRRSHDAVLSEMSNAVRSGARDAGATIGLRDLMGANRAGLDEVFRKAINMQMSDYVIVEKVYIRKVDIPSNIQTLWTQTIAMTAEQTKARAQFLTDSLNARRTVIVAEAEARKVELETRALATSPEVLRLRTAEAFANGFANICKGVTTCIIGGSVMDTWKSPLPR
jgi:regulator of protease activity HflC (stomatin/prohibitin superfamily)